MTKIEYFREGLSLGIYSVREGSSSIDRYNVALFHNVGDYDMFILDNGRCGAKIIDMSEDPDSKYSYQEVTNGVRQKWKVLDHQQCMKIIYDPLKEIVSRYLDDPVQANKMADELNEYMISRLFAYHNKRD